MEKKGLSPAILTWRRFRTNRLAMAGAIFILLAIMLALFSYPLSPDKTPDANRQILEIAAEKPGFRTDFLQVRKNASKTDIVGLEAFWNGRSDTCSFIPVRSLVFKDDLAVLEEYSKFGDDHFYRSLRLADIVYPLGPDSLYHWEGDSASFVLFDGRPVHTSLSALREQVEKQLTGKRFLLGTDRFGRDLLSRMIQGTRVSLSVGLIAVLISLLVGLLLGGMAGYFGGLTDRIVMWFVNVVWSIPTLLMVIAITMALGKGYWQVFVAVGLTMWVEVARVVRGQVISLREKEFVEAARALGLPPFRIIINHLLPNVLSPVVIISAANFASAILMEAGLSFLGIGVQPPVPSWGSMIKDHYGYIIVGQGYLAMIPGIAIMLMVLSFTLVGNGLRDAMDSRSL